MHDNDNIETLCREVSSTDENSEKACTREMSSVSEASIHVHNSTQRLQEHYKQELFPHHPRRPRPLRLQCYIVSRGR